MANKVSTTQAPVKEVPVKKAPEKKVVAKQPSAGSGLKKLFSKKSKAKMAEEIMRGVKIPMIPKKHKARAVGMIFNIMEQHAKAMR